MKITINDPILGTRTMQMDDHLALIRDQHKLLCAYRDDGRVPSEQLLEDIRIYEYILKAPNAKELASQYMKKADQLREERKTLYVRKIVVARLLGWEV